VLTAKRIFELANKAHFLYLTRNQAERGQLLKSVLLNCTTDGVNLSPTYRKPFDLTFQRAKNEEWSGRADLNAEHAACGAPRKLFSERCASLRAISFGVHRGSASNVRARL